MRVNKLNRTNIKRNENVSFFFQKKVKENCFKKFK